MDENTKSNQYKEAYQDLREKFKREDRTTRIYIRATPSEKQFIRRQAANMSMPLSEFCLSSILKISGMIQDGIDELDAK